MVKNAEAVTWQALLPTLSRLSSLLRGTCGRCAALMTMNVRGPLVPACSHHAHTRPLCCCSALVTMNMWGQLVRACPHDAHTRATGLRYVTHGASFAHPPPPHVQGAPFERTRVYLCLSPFCLIFQLRFFRIYSDDFSIKPQSRFFCFERRLILIVMLKSGEYATKLCWTKKADSGKRNAKKMETSFGPLDAPQRCPRQ